MAESLRVTPVSGTLGAEVDLDLSRDLSEGTVAALRSALLEHLVLFFRDQDLTPERHLALARRFGALARYPFVRGLDDHPDIVEVVKNPHERVNFGGIWHSDTTYLVDPPLGSLLYARELPPVGGDTLFANMYLAYETLSPGLRRVLDGLTAVNSADKADAAVTRVDRRRDRPSAPPDVATTAEHPVARIHPETGRRALYVNRGHTVRLAGFTVEESRPLLEFLYDHQSRPEFTCRFRWEAGSLAFWDNRSAQHYALNDYPGHRRVMHRVTIAAGDGGGHGPHAVGGRAFSAP